MTERAQNLQPQPQDPLAAMMSSLLLVHTAATPEALADAACTAAERGLGAPFAFVFFEHEDGALECKRPASELRRRSHQRAIDALGTVLFRAKVDPKDLPVIAEALDSGAAVRASLPELFAPLLGETRARGAGAALSVGAAWVAPLESAGERIGAFLVLAGGDIEPSHVRLLADHIAAAAADLRIAEAPSARGAIDISRSVFEARKLEAELERELSRATRYKRAVSICVVEVTNLRLLRERFGRALTERRLQCLGEELARHAREIDVIGAYKESGYTMILTEATAGGAGSVAQRLAAMAAEAARDGEEQVPGLELHLAIGHATCPEDGTMPDALFAAAERRMYGDAAKVA
jgi:diguanylate cyclase (GGDEF)-like protein